MASNDGSGRIGGEIVLRLVVRPAEAGVPWSARIEGAREPREFLNPIDLARHLVRLAPPRTPRRGLK